MTIKLGKNQNKTEIHFSYIKLYQNINLLVIIHKCNIKKGNFSKQATGQGCRARLSGKSAGQDCRAREILQILQYILINISITRTRTTRKQKLDPGLVVNVVPTGSVKRNMYINIQIYIIYVTVGPKC
jgi:hypothetical protein